MSSHRGATGARAGFRSKRLGLPQAALSAAIALATASSVHAQSLPAFPGAEGFGAKASGGRGGAVVKVTNLNASGPGSLQAAINRAGPRIVVFEVSGVINGDIFIPHGDLTIAGQTAPGAGITIHGHLYSDYPETYGNFIIRHIRVRPPMPSADWPAAQHDAVQLSANRVMILDHVDISHGVDENLDLYEGAREITIQRSIIGFSVRGGGHPDGAEHNFGMLNGPGGGRISVLKNLFVHNKRRTPAIADGPAEIVNNVVYNAREGFVHNNPAQGQFNLIGNVYIDGPSTNLLPFFFDPENGSAPPLSYFSRDNRVIHAGAFTGTVDNPFANTPFRNAYPGFFCCGVGQSMFTATAPFNFSSNAGYAPVKTMSSSAAYQCVLQRAGAWPRDVVSLWSVEDTAARTGSWSNRRPANWLEGLTPGTPPPDSDGDGMPNAWETARGLNPNSATDTHLVLPGGYPAIETYVNELADSLVPACLIASEGSMPLIPPQNLPLATPKPSTRPGLHPDSQPTTNPAHLRVPPAATKPRQQPKPDAARPAPAQPDAARRAPQGWFGRMREAWRELWR
jgi:pectate lyase